VPEQRAHVVVRGRVQGIYFRAEARSRASSLGVSGWVQNTAEGAVEAVFEGPAERVSSMVEWCRRGPRGALVSDVEVEWQTPRGEVGFAVR
jgi:acylphosphatase